MNVVSVDLGYGDVKVVDPAGGHHKIPARLAPYSGTDDLSVDTSVLAFSVNGGPPVVVGEKAVRYPGAMEPLADNRLADPETLPLLAAAIWQSNVEGDIVLASGAPLDTFAAEKPAVIQALKDKDLRLIPVNGESRDVTIRDLVLRPQGIAAALWLAANDLLPRDGGLGVVVDIGSRTTDVVTLSLDDLEPIRPLCFSIAVGVGDAVTRLGEAVAREAGTLRPPRHIAQQALTLPESAALRFSGKTIQVHELATRIKQEVANQIRHELRQRLRDRLVEVVAAAPVGGGANPRLLLDAVNGLGPGAEVVRIPEADKMGPFANVLGYRLAAERELARKAAAV